MCHSPRLGDGKQRPIGPPLYYKIKQVDRVRLPEPLQPQLFVPRRPPRRNGRYRQALREFDPAAPMKGRREKVGRAPAIRELALLGTHIQEGTEVKTDRWFIRWRLVENLARNNTARFMELFRDRARTAFYLCHVFAYWLRNIDNGDLILQYTNRGSPWFHTLADAEKWFNAKEEERVGMEGGTITRPSTKWRFAGFELLDVKAIFDSQPLVGTGPLPAWLRNLAHSQQMVALDTFHDNLCL